MTREDMHTYKQYISRMWNPMCTDVSYTTPYDINKHPSFLLHVTLHLVLCIAPTSIE